MKNIMLGDDGIYRWHYEVNMYKNPSILLVLWRIFAGISLGIWVFVTLVSAGDPGFWTKNFWSETLFFSIFLVGMLIFSTFGYLMYAIYMGGGKNTVFFLKWTKKVLSIFRCPSR